MKDQAGSLLGQAAGFVGFRTIAIGLEHGLLSAITAHGAPMTASQLAEVCGYDPFYTGVWCRAAFAAGVLEDAGDERYSLGPHMDTLLLDAESPEPTLAESSR